MQMSMYSEHVIISVEVDVRVAVVGLSNAGVCFSVSLSRGRFDCGAVLQTKEEKCNCGTWIAAPKTLNKSRYGLEDIVDVAVE